MADSVVFLFPSALTGKKPRLGHSDDVGVLGSLAEKCSCLTAVEASTLPSNQSVVTSTAKNLIYEGYQVGSDCDVCKKIFR